MESLDNVLHSFTEFKGMFLKLGTCIDKQMNPLDSGFLQSIYNHVMRFVPLSTQATNSFPPKF